MNNTVIHLKVIKQYSKTLNTPDLILSILLNELPFLQHKLHQPVYRPTRTFFFVLTLSQTKIHWLKAGTFTTTKLIHTSYFPKFQETRLAFSRTTTQLRARSLFFMRASDFRHYCIFKSPLIFGTFSRKWPKKLIWGKIKSPSNFFLSSSVVWSSQPGQTNKGRSIAANHREEPTHFLWFIYVSTVRTNVYH